MVRKEHVEKAKASLDRLVAHRSDNFKIGRVAKRFLSGLSRAERYSEYAEGPFVVFEGTGPQADKMESVLTDYSWDTYGKRCDNLQVGGGSLSKDNSHVVYVFFAVKRRRSVKVPSRTDSLENGPLWGGLKKAWNGFKAANARGDKRTAREYAQAINLFQVKLGLEVSRFDL